MKSVLDECLAVLNSKLEQFPWGNRRAYGDWLAQTYYYVQHSTRLLATAAARFPLDERGSAFHYRFAAHIAEEKKHEMLTLHDLKVLGFTLEDFAEHHVTRMFYEPQYFKIEHQEPLALFGYILPLESISVTKGAWIMNSVREHYGDRPTAFLKVHVSDDDDHLEKAFAVLKAATPNQGMLIELNLRQTTVGYCAMLTEIERQVGSR